jgi:penicillin-binding protein 1A
MAEVLGVQSPLQPLRSIALGAQEVTVLDMATVQATLAAGGIYREPSVVTKISGADGTVLYERGAQAGERVLDEEVAWQVTTALQDVVDHGTGVRADLRRPTAGKTGTTQDTADAWFTGYTPDFAAAVWVGFHEGRVSMEPPLTRIRVEGGTWPAEIFARMGLRTLENTPATPFPIPDAALTTVSVDLRRDCLPTAFTPVDQVGERAYLSGTEPTAECKDDSEATAVADVPDVSGKTWDEARSILEAAGLRALPQPTFTTTVPPGFAIAQDPSAGRQRRLTEGYIVRVRVSSADRTQVKVPTVIGLGVTEAIAALDRAGFPTDIDRECPDDAEACTGPRDIVYEQTPGAGMATIHAVIDIKVYPGP